MSTRYTFTCATCGRITTSSTAARAAYGDRKHDCAKHLRRVAATARRIARANAVDRTPQPCHHPRTTHKHGTYSAYTHDTCRCRPCTDAAAAYERDRTRRNAYGRTDLVDAQPARDHIRNLQAAGMGYRNIARTAGLSDGVMSKLLFGHPRRDGTRRPPTKRLHTATMTAILAVRPQLADGAQIDATGSRRRLQALVAIGYSAERLGILIGIDRQVIDALITSRRILVTVGTARTIATRYADLENTTPTGVTPGQRGSIERARRRGARAGWLTPAWWDTDTINDPQHDPRTSTTDDDGDPVAIQLTIDGQRPRTLTTTERHAALRELHAKGQTDAVAARHLGVTPTTVLRDRHALGLPAVDAPNTTRALVAA